jgi:hypothetical protein
LLFVGLRRAQPLLAAHCPCFSYDVYAWNVEKRLKPAFGRKPLQRIDKNEVAGLIRELKAEGVRRVDDPRRDRAPLRHLHRSG